VHDYGRRRHRAGKAAEFARRFGLTAVDCERHTEALAARDDVDLACIRTPPFTHAQIASDALRAGKHAIVEMPIASSLEECDRLGEQAVTFGSDDSRAAGPTEEKSR
jgi:UDP-N-acetyl-2-amino-2-deoxyglucuronate dehydrogenase